MVITSPNHSALTVLQWLYTQREGKLNIMKTHPTYTINFTKWAAKHCQQMNNLVRLGLTIDQASKALGLSKSTGRRYFNGSYDFNPGCRRIKKGKRSFTCVRLGAKVNI